jgi:hypothetical protein
MESLLDKYIALVEYPDLKNILEPYYSARFTSEWRGAFGNNPSVTKTALFEIEKLRQRNEGTRQWVREHNCLPGFLRDHEELFLECTLSAFEGFLKKYEEGALVTLILLQTAEDPEACRFKMGWFAVKQVFNSQYLPGIVNREPI